MYRVYGTMLENDTNQNCEFLFIYIFILSSCYTLYKV